MDGVRAVDLSKGHKKLDFDLVCCMQVFEHLPNLLKELQKMVQSLKGESIIYIEVPHEKLLSETNDSKEAYLKKIHWHEHINFFTKDSLIQLFDKAGI